MKKYIIIIASWMQILFCIPVNICFEIVKGAWSFIGTPVKGFRRGVWRTADLLTKLDLYKLKGGGKC